MSFPFLPFQPLLLPLLRLVSYTMVEILTPMYYIVEYNLNHTHHSRAVAIRFSGQVGSACARTLYPREVWGHTPPETC